ncbi:hypothetical protein YC2023_123262 [Brassica napus]
MEEKREAVHLHLTPAHLVVIARDKYITRSSFDLASMVTEGNDMIRGDDAFLQRAYEKIEVGLTRYAQRL